MVAIARDYTIRGSVQDDTERGLNAMKRRLEQFSKWQEQQERGHGGHLGRVFSDQSTTGLDPLGRALTLGIGGLQAGALAVATRAAADVTAKAVEMSQAFRHGQANAASMTLEIAKGIPIVGNIAEAEENVYELITHSKEKQEQFNLVLAEAGRFQEQQTERLNHAREDELAHMNRILQLQRELNGARERGADASRFGFGTNEVQIRKQAEEAKQKVEDYFSSGSDVKAIDDRIQESAQKYGVTAQYTKYLQEERAKILSGRNAERDRQKKNIDEDAIAAIAANQSRLDEFNRRRIADLAIQDEEAGNATARANEQTAAAQLRTQGEVHKGRIADIAAAAQAARDAANIAAERQSEETSNADELSRIEERRKEKIGAIDAKEHADRAQAEKDFNIERKHLAFESAQAVQDATVAENAQRLRALGLGYDAERVLRKREYDRRLAEIDQAAQEEIAKNRDNADAIRAKAEADKKKAGAEFTEGERQAREREIAGRVGTAQELLRGRISALQDEAKYGNIAAASEAKRLEIASQFADKRAKLNQMIRDPNVGAAEKELAKSQLAGLDAQQQRAEHFAFFTGGFGAPGLNLSRASGAALKAQEENSPFIQMQKLMQQGNQDLSQIREATKIMAEALKKNPEMAPLLSRLN